VPRPFSFAHPLDRTEQANVSQTQTGTPSSDVRRIEPGKPIEREIRGGESHVYEISLQAGQYLKAIVDQRGIDVKVTVTGADGKRMFEFNAEGRKQGQETIEAVAEAAGTYRLSVEPPDKQAAAGRYEIRLAELRTATEIDRQLQKALTLFDESVRLYRNGQVDAALPLARQSLEVRQKALGPAHYDVGRSLSLIAVLHQAKGDSATAERFYRQALETIEKAMGPDHPSVASLLTNIANIYARKGDYSKAEPLYQRALAIRESVLGSDHADVGSAVSNLAVLYMHKRDYAKAGPLFQRALAITEKAVLP
jgi:tetratricopeptide (TPR) repeat protein